RFKLNCLNEKFLLKKMSSGKISPSITKRPKQPYRAPIATTFFNSNSPSYFAEMLSATCLQSYGLFNPIKVNSLINKILMNKNISEVDQMAIAGILSTQLLYKMFVKDPITTTIDKLGNLKIILES
ncbi:MAG TPA: asparagine synthase-related protein, partial [Hanamia sp.]|nr:asparagine synthase-related protein [Hanamia sp.]